MRRLAFRSADAILPWHAAIVMPISISRTLLINARIAMLTYIAARTGLSANFVTIRMAGRFQSTTLMNTRIVFR